MELCAANECPNKDSTLKGTIPIAPNQQEDIRIHRCHIGAPSGVNTLLYHEQIRLS